MEQRDLGEFFGAPREPGAVWQVDLFLLPLWMKAEEGSEPRLEMVWAALALDLPTGEIAMSRVAGAPEGSLATDVLPDLVRRTGYRPERIQVVDLEVADKIRRALGEPGSAVPEIELRHDLLDLRTVFEAFREHMARSGETPAYLRALYRCAESLRDAGRHNEAIEPLQELLRLDRVDSARARYLLADSLLRLRRHDELEELLSRYRDASAFWAWPRVLLAFRVQGDSPAARTLLAQAWRAHPLVPAALLDPPDVLPTPASRLIASGSEEEAQIYAVEERPVWETTVGALEWLATRTERKEAEK